MDCHLKLLALYKIGNKIAFTGPCIILYIKHEMIIGDGPSYLEHEEGHLIDLEHEELLHAPA